MSDFPTGPMNFDTTESEWVKQVKDWVSEPLNFDIFLY